MGQFLGLKERRFGPSLWDSQEPSPHFRNDARLGSENSPLGTMSFWLLGEKTQRFSIFFPAPQDPLLLLPSFLLFLFSFSSFGTREPLSPQATAKPSPHAHHSTPAHRQLPHLPSPPIQVSLSLAFPHTLYSRACIGCGEALLPLRATHRKPGMIAVKEPQSQSQL